VLDQQQEHPTGQQEEDELRERVRGGGISAGIHDRRDDQEPERRDDRVAPVQAGPHGVSQVDDQQADEDRGVRNIHRTGAGATPDY